MRILPVGLFFANRPVEEFLDAVRRASSLKHRHPRSLTACGFYYLMVRALLEGFTAEGACLYAIEQVTIYYAKLPYAEGISHFERIFSILMGSIPEAVIKSGSYVIHTLEASVLCLLNRSLFQDAVLKAVNLGDTDTTGCLIGGLAEACYDLKAIPTEWLDVPVRTGNIDKLFEQFVNDLTCGERDMHVIRIFLTYTWNSYAGNLTTTYGRRLVTKW